MTLTSDAEFEPLPRDDDEGLFSRDINGQLVRLDAPTQEDYDRSATLKIDGREVTVRLAEPLRDADGNVVLDIDGRTTPRYTTIYDAAMKLWDEKQMPIPVLCHQPHMKPVAVCRMCVVQIYGTKRGRRAPERKLLPACQHQVKHGMEVFTMKDAGPDGERVRRAVNVMTELLTADHLKPAVSAELAPFNELQVLSDRCGLTGSRFTLDVLTQAPNPPPPGVVPPRHRPFDESSPVFVVDHSACILCDRCSRACDDVKKNNVIGRTGKGRTAGIGFDLDNPMGTSSCVQCGECMVSCPTTAITFNPVAKVKIRGGSGDAELLPASELTQDPMFAGVPPKFLLWQEGLVVRRTVKAGQTLCKQGDPGNTAFIIKSGRIDVLIWPPEEPHPKSGLLRILNRSAPRKGHPKRLERGPGSLLGEMAALSGNPRTADMVAGEDSVVLELRRNVLDRLMRSPAQRERLQANYRNVALDSVLRGSDLFKTLPPDEFQRCLEFLRPRLKFVTVNPTQTIYKQGDWAEDWYLVRLGHVRVGVRGSAYEAGVFYRGPGTSIGEIALLAISPMDAGKSVEELSEAIGSALAESPQALTSAVPAGQQISTCTALDHVELARVGRADFLEMVSLFKSFRRQLIATALETMRAQYNQRPEMREYIEQGLYQGQSLLVLDLDNCTRCDECTRACVEQHGTASHGVPISRMFRDGLRFGDYLVATSCRSCKDAYCMIGCPVDAIHRGKHLQIVIEDHCIGCGLCAKNCPYGNIEMMGNQKQQRQMTDPNDPNQTKWVAQPKASTCDLCDADGKQATPKPRCVYACPHDAAHRMTGEELLQKVIGSPAPKY